MGAWGIGAATAMVAAGIAIGGGRAWMLVPLVPVGLWGLAVESGAVDAYRNHKQAKALEKKPERL